MPRKKSGNFNQVKYNNQFNKEHYKKYSFIAKVEDIELIEYIEQLKANRMLTSKINQLLKDDLKKA